MTPLDTFHIFHYGIELILALLILYAVFFAIKNFKLVIWKKGWYVIGIGAVLFILVEIGELLETFVHSFEINPLLIVPLHMLHIFAFGFFAIGIFMLSISVGRTWGKI